MNRGALLLALVWALQPVHADGWDAHLVWETKLTDRGVLRAIESDGRMVVALGTTEATHLLSTLSRARREGAKWRPPTRGLYLTDHGFVAGEVTIDADGRASVRHPRLGAHTLEPEAVAGYGKSHGYIYKDKPTLRVKGKRPLDVKAVAELAERLTATGADGKPISVARADVSLLALRPLAKTNARRLTLQLSDGSRLRGAFLRFDGKTFTLDTRWLGSVSVPAGEVDRIDRGVPRSDEGLLLVCDYEGKTIHRIDLVSGKTWKKAGLNYPNVFFRLEPGKWLVSDSRDDELQVMDDSGKVLRKVGGLSNPWDVKIDKDGNWVVVCLNSDKIYRMTPAGKKLHTWKLKKGVLRAVPLRNGNLLVAQTYADRVAEIDAKGKTIWEWKVKRPVDIDLLPNGNMLICLETQKKVIELTREKKIVWSFDKTLTNPYDADRLPNGNTLIVDRGTGRVLEVDPEGQILWERKGFKGPVEVVRY